MIGKPNIWRIARPITLANGEGLLPFEVDSQGWANGGAWEEENAFTRDWDGRTQWLRWSHEATIAAVADTDDDTMVLTFETALPYEDKRHSTIGVFKRYLSDLKYYITDRKLNGTFIGYTPPRDLPDEDLEHMLDWNKILQTQTYSQEVIDKSLEILPKV